jgi:uncharacterized protein
MTTWHELLRQDHELTERVLAAMEKVLDTGAGPPSALLSSMLDYFRSYVDRLHTMKEEQHLFPLLEERGVPRQAGPLAVMLHEHLQARGILGRLGPLAEAVIAGDRERLPELRATFEEYSALLKGHFWKENDVLYPMALRVLKPADDATIVAGIEQAEASVGPGTREHFTAVAREIIEGGELRDLSSGLDRDVLAAILNTLPVELSFVDHEDTVRYFSHEHGHKIFARSRGVIGAKVQNCHPPKSVHVVKQILADFKAGTRDVAEFWIDMGGRVIHIRYWPVRDPAGRYLGCLETVQDVTSIRKLSGEHRLLDPG